MEEIIFGYTFERELRECADFKALIHEQQDSILQVMQDPGNIEEYLRAFNELQLPHPLIAKVQKLKDTSMLLSKISQKPVDFTTIKSLFDKISTSLDPFTIGALQSTLCSLFLTEGSIAEIMKYFEFLPIFKGTELEDSTDSYLFLSITSLLNIQDQLNIDSLAEYITHIIHVKDYSLSSRTTFDIIQTKFIEEVNKHIENSKSVNEAYLLIQKDITEELVKKVHPDAREKEVLTIESPNDLIFPEVEEVLYSATRPPNKSVVIVKGAISRKNNKPVAVKTTISSNVDHLDKLEGKLLQELTRRKCKNVVKLYGMYETQISDQEFCFSLVLEKATMSLGKEIKQWFKMPEDQRKTIDREGVALDVLNQISFAMKQLSNNDIWHRDIKPANILVFEKTKTGDNGDPMVIRKYKLTDFNISHEFLRNENGMTVAEQCYNAARTIRFAAPEINRADKYREAFGDFKVNFNLCDIYSLGLSVLRMLTKKEKNDWNTNLGELQARMDRIITKTVVKNSELKQILLRMIRLNFKERITISELRKCFKNDATYIPE